MRRVIWSILVLAAFGLAVIFPSLLATPPSIVTGSPVSNETVRIAMTTVQEAFNQLDPHDAAGSSMGLLNNLYESLVGVDPGSLKPFPQLAERWDIKDKGTRYVFYLRKGVKFHDGTELTSDDVKLSFDRIVAKRKHFSWQIVANRVKSVLPRGKYLVEFVVTPSATPFVVQAEMVKIVSADAVRKHRIGEDYATAYLKDTIVGTGPYKLVQWIPKDRFVIARNDDYWGKKPYFARAILLDVPEISTQTLMVQKGEVDLATMSAQATPEQVNSLRNTPGLRVIEEPGVTVNFLRIYSKGKTPTADVHVRRAITYAMNYPRYWQVWKQNILRFNSGPVASQLLGGLVPSTLPKYDLDKAREELRQSRFPNGGFKLVGISNVVHPVQQPAYEILKTELAKLNITLNIETRDWVAVYQQMLRWKKETNPDADVHILGLNLPALVADASFFMSIYECQSDLNFGAYCNTDVDRLITRTASAASTVAERNRAYLKAIELIIADSPDIILGRANHVSVVRRSIEGYVTDKQYHPFGVSIARLSRGR